MQDRQTTFLSVGCSVRGLLGHTALGRLAVLAARNLAYPVLETAPDCK